MFNGIGNNMDNLFMLSDAKSRAITPENPKGEVAGGARIEAEDGNAAEAARGLGKGWKVNPYIFIEPGETAMIADIDGPGAISHIWVTPLGSWRSIIIRFYWDGQETPSVECPLTDFFCAFWKEFHQISSLPVCNNPRSGLNCYWTMPFRKHCRITLENIGFKKEVYYYQIDYTLGDVPDDSAYFHAQFRRMNPLPYKEVYTVLDGIEGKGQYVGTAIAWGSNNNGWWGEGEMKFYIDGDGEYPTICGTGLEDYFCGSYDFEDERTHLYREFTTPYTGFYPISQDPLYQSQKRFGMYRFHITDPIRFEKDLKVTVQALGWREDRRYLPLQDDISSVAFWYQTLPSLKFPDLPGYDYLEII